MPIYEYRCEGCRKRVSLFLRSLTPAEPPRCPLCGSLSLARLFSRFGVIKSEESRLERLADPSTLADLDENDPASVARWAKRMGKELGEDVGDDFNEALESAVEEEAAGGGGGGGKTGGDNFSGGDT